MLRKVKTSQKQQHAKHTNLNDEMDAELKKMGYIETPKTAL